MNDGSVRPGDIVAGKYRVERVLGAGNMGVVVAATHVDLGQLVALKLMLPGRAAGPEQRQRFLREARAAARLRSQHVARVLDVGANENAAPYIAMEFLEGQDLAALLHARGQLPFAEAIEYILQTCEAVGEAHAARVVHRDLKPANLFLTKDVSGSSCIKVLDFGVSKLIGDLTLTADSQALGSPLYMSPEQMNSSRDVDTRSDIWALGIILYQLVAGRTPFDADTMQGLCSRVFFGQPTPLCEFRKDAPPGFEAVILKCLERDRDQRWRNVAELAAALAPYASGLARIYAERVSRVLTVKATPTASAPELPVTVPTTVGVSSTVPGYAVQPTEAGDDSPTGMNQGTPPVTATSSTPGANSDVSTALSATRRTSASSRQQRANSRSRAPFVLIGILIALGIPVVVLVLFVVISHRDESARSVAAEARRAKTMAEALRAKTSALSATEPLAEPAVVTPPSVSSSASTPPIEAPSVQASAARVGRPPRHTGPKSGGSRASSAQSPSTSSLNEHSETTPSISKGKLDVNIK
ncbi:serine/threonine protein kinase [Sorangium sp. So ce385]|uniref:serine/threonine protein kinase n=1 Tax=Sorangium sp. So ce385 TaxID=3133308 RepID=UPI003F5C87CE